MSSHVVSAYQFCDRWGKNNLACARSSCEHLLDGKLMSHYASKTTKMSGPSNARGVAKPRLGLCLLGVVQSKRQTRPTGSFQKGNQDSLKAALFFVTPAIHHHHSASAPLPPPSPSFRLRAFTRRPPGRPPARLPAQPVRFSATAARRLPFYAVHRGSA